MSPQLAAGWRRTRGTPGCGCSLQLAGADRRREDKQTAAVFSGRPYHLALGKELQYFPDYVCTQTSAAGKLCNPERGGVGAREEGLEGGRGGGPTLHPAALGPSQRSCSPRGTALPAADGLHHRHLSPPPAAARAPAPQPPSAEGEALSRCIAAQGLLTASSLSARTEMHIFVTQAI